MGLNLNDQNNLEIVMTPQNVDQKIKCGPLMD